MKLRYLISLSLVLFFVFTSFESEAQRRNKYKKRKTKSRAVSHYKGGSVGGRFRPYTYVSANINALNYFGDMAPVNKAASTDVSFTRPGFGGEIGHKFSPYLAARVGFNYGRIKGDDITSDPTDEQAYPRYLRNLSFRNDIKELSGGVEVYLFPNHGGANVRPTLNFYLFVGAAIFHHEPKGLVPEMDYTTGGTVEAPQAGEWVKLRELGTEGQFIDGIDVETYKPFQFSVPIAVGAIFRLPGPFSAGIEFGYRHVFTDYLDDVSSNYVPFDQFDDPLARIMSDRSAEPVGAWSEIDRSGIVRVVGETLPDGVTYYAAGDVGGGLDTSGEGIRGNPDDNDIIFITTLRLRMVLSGSRGKGKFR